MKPSPRRRSREIALQALYAWQLAGGNPQVFPGEHRWQPGSRQHPIAGGLIANLDERGGAIADHIRKRA